MVLVIDPQVAGISGDMLLCSLINMGADKSKIIDKVHQIENYLKGSKIVKIDFDKIVKHGTEATHLVLDIKEDHNERKGIEMQECILSVSDKIGLSDKAKIFAKESIRSLLYAESRIHGETLESVHFHEASSIDTLIDIIGTAIALDDLRLFEQEIITMPVAVGGGKLDFSHGIVSNPASAIVEIFRNSDIIIHGGPVRDELTTPTGASMLVNLSKSCTEFYPSMKISQVGYGAGCKDFDGFANVLKIVKGELASKYDLDTVQILETNLDDISGETIGHLIDKLISNGAKDVTVTSAITKKGRPTNLVSIICESGFASDLTGILVSETGTLGVRTRTSNRYVVPRTIVTVPISINGKNFAVRCKIVKYDQVIKHCKAEADDIKSIADSLSISFKVVSDMIYDQVKRKLNIK